MVNSAEIFPKVLELDRAEWVWRELWTLAAAEDATDETVRLAAMIGITRLTEARRGELANLRVGDVDLKGGHVTVRRTKFQQIHTLPLDPDLQRVLETWTKRRERLVQRHIEGGKHDALLVTCHHTTWTTQARRPATKQIGLPLSPQGVLLAWKRWSRQANAHYLGQIEGWKPLPQRFESIRMAWRRH
ncbi:tyrosine-type recombinase/integrase [Streptomyces sp. NPDC057302]|uniref:tyrosine-type recombinase/integrase n=1 Tax=Streptomyces sp. NPDC057302 TaxID=3346094 RepID=UPI00362ABD3A